MRSYSLLVVPKSCWIHLEKQACVSLSDRSAGFHAPPLPVAASLDPCNEGMQSKECDTSPSLLS